MAFYVKIEKCAEDELAARYRFWSVLDNCGELEIDKRSGEVRLLAQINGDQQGHLFNRAAVKIMREWKLGSLPDVTEWAS
jgi:hypothetical protein